ncbi:MAG: orotidine-5'-phosphate decarboxylase [Nitrosomonas sp.]|nr:orotidine-5'-phosphate decarboxylase [Nitrosomonas sp.]
MAGVGLDPDVTKIPESIWSQVGGKQNISEGFFLFCKEIIDSTSDIALDYKVNSNFFQGEGGRSALKKTFDYLKENAPDVIRVCDGKFADIGNTAEKIAEEVFDNLDADAVLLNPYMGFDAIEPFVKRKDKIAIICINTSNESSSEVQNLVVDGQPLWLFLLKKAMNEWNMHGNIIPVLSASHAIDVREIRKIVQDSPILLAGVGTQGGSLSESVPPLLDKNGYGLMISSSRQIIYATRKNGESIGDAARRELTNLKSKINQVKKNAKSN